jgi:hypothetical protein
MIQFMNFILSGGGGWARAKDLRWRRDEAQNFTQSLCYR